MKYKISPDRKKLIFSANKKERKVIQSLGSEADTDKAMVDFFDRSLIVEWIDPADTGDLTSAPMVGIRDIDTNDIVERWAFMDYQVRSVLGDLRDTGKCVFVSD